MAAAVSAASELAWQWGVHDCCISAANIALAITGTDPADPHRGYKTEEEANEIIAGYGSLAEMVTALVGPEIHPSRAKRGDFVMASLANGDTIGVCLGPMCAFAGPIGWVFEPRSVATTAWRIE